MNKAEIYYREKYSLPNDEFPELGEDDIRIIKLMNEFSEEQKKLSIPRVSESVTCWHCNGWGYTLLPNGKRDKHCTVCDGSNVR